MRTHSWLGRSRSTRLVVAADHPTTSLNYPNHAAASFRNVHLACVLTLGPCGVTPLVLAAVTLMLLMAGQAAFLTAG
jgi:hypothetical protein